MKYLVVLSLLILCSTSAFAQEAMPIERIDILEVLKSYSNRTGVKFVADPRVKARVKMIGVKLDELDQTDINRILLVHNFVAYEKSDIVYIIPRNIEGEFGEQIGTKWEDN